MEFSQIAQALGIDTYPSLLNEIYAAGNYPDPCNRALLEDLETRYGIFGQYYGALLQAMDALPRDKYRYAWAQVASAYVAATPVALASKLPMPTTDGTAAGDLLPMLILLTQIPQSEALYRSKGFSQEQIQAFMDAYAKGIAIVERSVGRPAVNQLYYWWLCLYAKAAIFRCGDFQFELRQLPNTAIYLQKGEQLVAVMTAGTYHSSGQVLGSAGCTEEMGAFTASLRETEDAWYGHPATGRGVAAEEHCFPKDQWTCVLKPGDTVLSMHISRGACLTPEAVDAAIIQARQIAARSYPEWTSRGIYCSSWLLDPVLTDILGAGGNIHRFAERFACYPILSGGRAGLGYVFPGYKGPEEDLPENTRLQKGLKTHFLDGGQLYGCSGAMIIQEG